MLINFYKILLITLVFFTACVPTPTTPQNEQIIDNSFQFNKIKLKLNQSNEGRYLYGMLINRKTGIFVRKIGIGETYNSRLYELIKVYENSNVSPSFQTNNISELKKSFFGKGGTFDNMLNGGSNNNPDVTNIITNFNKKLFLKTAETAMNEMYRNIKLKVKFISKNHIDVNEDGSLVEIEIEHKPNIDLNRLLFSINKSLIYERDEPIIRKISPILQRRLYRLPTPRGKNDVEVKISSTKGEKDDDQITINNKLEVKPTFHIVAIGINEFPNWGVSQDLKFAISDAKNVKGIINKRSSKIFTKSKIQIKPHFLGHKNTTKENVEKLINNIRKKVRPNDYFLLYVSSHGIIENNKYYFATSDYDELDFAQNHIHEKQISDYLINIPTVFRMAILDTCNSGTQIDTIKRDIIGLDLGRKEGISIVTATKSVQVAQDNGLFSNILVKGLDGEADADADSIVDSMEIAEYVKNNVKSKSESLGIKQDAMVFPNPKKTVGRRFALTHLEKQEFKGFKPNIFTPRESELYINAINQNNASMMEGLRRNNTRHRENEKTLILSNNLSAERIISALKQSNSVDIPILFSSGSAELNSVEKEKLKIIAEALNSSDLKNKKIILEGHTDSDLGLLSHIELSQRRANSARNILQTNSVSSSRLVTIGFGDMYPIAVEKAQNRRVSIFIYD